MVDRDFFELTRDFFGAYLMQDYDLYADTLEGVARYYAETADPANVRGLIGELNVLAEVPGGDIEVAALARELDIGVVLGLEAPESSVVRGLAREMAVAFAERLERETAAK